MSSPVPEAEADGDEEAELSRSEETRDDLPSQEEFSSALDG
jgi:hypothetical protein